MSRESQMAGFRAYLDDIDGFLGDEGMALVALMTFIVEVHRVASKMDETNWSQSVQQLEGLRKAIAQRAAKLKNPEGLVSAVEEITTAYLSGIDGMLQS